jgi:hypothetical protein
MEDLQLIGKVGTFMGVPATGRQAQWQGISIYTVRHGKIVDAWYGEDMLGLLMQLGAFPPARGRRGRGHAANVPMVTGGAVASYVH